MIASKFLVLSSGLFALLPTVPAQQPRAHVTWQQQVREELPVMGHRNWILIVDSAYPLQTSSGVETVETSSSEIEVVREVLKQIDASVHVRPVVYMDAELPLVPDSDAPGVTQYRKQIAAVLGKRPVESLPHEKIISRIDEAGHTFHVLVLKTNLAIPYTSVFLQLNCKYWSDEAESRLRNKLK